MPRRPANFTEAEVRRAIRAVESAGLPIGGVTIRRDGAIDIHTTAPVSADDKEAAAKLWFEKHAG